MRDKVSAYNSFGYNFVLLVEELIFEFDPNHNGEITEEEFNVICKYISSRGSASFPPIEGKSSTSRSGLKQNATATIHMYEQEKKNTEPCCRKQAFTFSQTTKYCHFWGKYCLLAFNPHSFSNRIMNQLRMNAENSGDYTRAKMMKLRFEEFSRAEQQR